MVEGLQEGQPQLLKVLLADFGEAKQLSQVRAASLLATERVRKPLTVDAWVDAVDIGEGDGLCRGDSAVHGSRDAGGRRGQDTEGAKQASRLGLLLPCVSSFVLAIRRTCSLLVW